MNNFIFKSANRLIKNSSEAQADLNYVSRQVYFVLKEQRQQRSDLQTINKKLDRLLVDKHLQMQVDEYFDSSIRADDDPEDSKQDLDWNG